MIKYFPITLFSYNRPDHLTKVLNHMIKSSNIKNYKIFLFCDGPKNNFDEIKIKKIKEIINSNKKKLNFVKIVFRKNNIGLANNVIKSLNYVFSKNEASIVIEDDIVLGKYALDFINHYLNVLNNNKKIGSVSAYSYLKNFKQNNNSLNYYLTKRHSSWAWGTWKRVWYNINWDEDYKINFLSNETSSSNFNDLGNDMKLMLWGQKNNYINSWAVRFNYYCHQYNLKSFQSWESKIENIGNDGSGTHGILYRKNKFKLKNINKKIKLYQNLSLHLDNEINLFIKKSHKKSIRLLFLFFLNLLLYPLKYKLNRNKQSN